MSGFALALPWLPAAWLVALGAGVVRGFSGFGFSALTVAGLTLFVPPASVVPAVLALEVLASVSLIRSAIRNADRRWLAWLVGGNLLFIPIGLALLAWLPELLMRLLVGGVLLVSALALLAAGERTWPTTMPLRLATGVLSGLMNGVAASGGVAGAMRIGISNGLVCEKPGKPDSALGGQPMPAWMAWNWRLGRCLVWIRPALTARLALVGP